MTDGSPTAFVDANVFIPYLSGHDATLLARAASVIETEEIRILPIATILETAWVLRRHYRYQRQAIAAALHDLVVRSNVEVAELPTAAVLSMIGLWRDGRIGSIGDAIIAASMETHQAARIFSFDRRFPRDFGWEVVVP